MTMITLSVTNTRFTTKIAGVEVEVDFALMHHTWLEAHLRKAAQRFINDDLAGQFDKGQEAAKLEAWRLAYAAMADGSEMPAKARRTSSGASVTPVEDLALKNAKADLTATFKKVTGMAKMIDMVKASAKVAAFFTVKDEKAEWNDDQVTKWIVAQVAKGRDYMAEAKATLDADDSELDF